MAAWKRANAPSMALGDGGGVAQRAGRERRRSATPLTAALRTPIVESRHVARAVKRAAWRRDGGQCAYVASTGRRCTERVFLEFHHVQAYARRGEGTVGNISLRCRGHDQYEAELVFGPRRASAIP